MLVVFFNLLLAGCAAYAFLRGGAPERVVAAAFLLAAMASYLTPSPPVGEFQNTQFGLFIVDIALLVVLVMVALWANRFWPIWIASFQVFVLLTHLTMAYQGDILPIIYFAVVSRMAYPMLMMLVAGTVLHLRRLQQHGCDPDWSPGTG